MDADGGSGGEGGALVDIDNVTKRSVTLHALLTENMTDPKPNIHQDMDTEHVNQSPEPETITPEVEEDMCDEHAQLDSNLAQMYDPEDSSEICQINRGFQFTFLPIDGIRGGDDGSARNLRDRSTLNRKPVQERVRQKRQTLQDMTRPLKHWLYHHRDNPYPSKSDKVQLARSSQMTMTQVSNWFANARRRLKNTVRGSELTWAKRIKLYNNFVEGNQELLSVGSSSSDDDLAGELTTTDPDREPDQNSDSRVQADVQERIGEQCHQAEISDTSALSNQGAWKEDNLQDRLRGDTYSVPQQQLQAFDTHTPSALLTFSTISQAYSQSNTANMPTRDNQHSAVTSQHVQQPQQTTQTTDELNTAHARVNPISGFGEGENLLQDGGDGHPKYKNSIMQRYLTDSYNSYQNALLSLNSPVSKDPKEKERHRNPSGSLSSHDYEEYMSSASSSRSTPTREHQVDGHVDEYEEFSRHWPDIKTRAEDDLYWKEISAALALTSLARSKYPTQTQYTTTPSTD